MRKDLTGQRFGRLIVESYSHTDPPPKRYANWNCVCDCGNKTIVRSKNLLIGNNKSCGCLRIELRTKHGLHAHPLYRRWVSMMHRCYNKKDSNYINYGYRGIKVCDRWHDVSLYIEDLQSSYKEGLQLDRINNDGNYELSNIRWTTRSQNIKNRRCRTARQSSIDHVSYDRKADAWNVLFRFKNQEEAESFALGIING